MLSGLSMKRRSIETLACRFSWTSWFLLNLGGATILPAALGSQNPGVDAASEVAGSDPACKRIQPFYWEIGTAQGAHGSGSTGDGSVGANTILPIASGSKLYFAAYVLERRHGILSPSDREALQMKSGYISFTFCFPSPLATVNSCLRRGDNGAFTPSARGKFHYGGGHFQIWSARNGLASDNRAALTSEYERYLGHDLGMAFNNPQPAGGLKGSASRYAAFLRRILRHELAISGFLGAFPTCTDPNSCSTALNSPAPGAWHYSLGH